MSMAREAVEWERKYNEVLTQNARLKSDNEKFLEELADLGDFSDPEQSLMNILMTIRFQFESTQQLSNQGEDK
jgi:hypothetical protein